MLTGPLGTAGCRFLTDPPLPAAAERFTPPPVYARWWTLTEACSGIVRPLDDVQFYRVPHASSVPDGGRGDVAGYWSLASNRIVLAGSYTSDGGTVRHEMLHALVRASGHPPAFFQGRCAGVVYCPDVGCADAGPRPVTRPPDASTLPLAELTLGVDAIPASVSHAGADRALTIAIRATNPTAQPAWVPLDVTPGVPAPRVAWRGFRIVPAAQPLPITDLTRVDATGIVAIDTVRRVPFASGETKWVVFDMSGAEYPPGDYRVVGIFNTRQVAVPLTVTP